MFEAKKGHGDKCRQNYERAKENFLVSELRHEITVQKSTEKAPTTGSVTQTSLPGGRKLVFAEFREVCAVFLLEYRIGVEISDQDGVVTFHNDAHGDHDRPEDGCRVCLDGFERRELVFCGRSFFGCVVKLDTLHLSLEIADIFEFNLGGYGLLGLFGNHWGLLWRWNGMNE